MILYHLHHLPKMLLNSMITDGKLVSIALKAPKTQGSNNDEKCEFVESNLVAYEDSPNNKVSFFKRSK